ncbi:transcription factor MafB-like, partial [Anopheles aquasalis]|uniref:transcription factor MafB-like n=1 Tax=Anopheles aquasalis TaxID=42839 RepID=UPI00215B5311
PPPPRRGGPSPSGAAAAAAAATLPGSQQTATSFQLQLNQDHLTVKQPGMKLFPNYTPPIPPHHLHNGNGPPSGASASNPANHHYHQITYQHTAGQQQTLAPLRLNQDHFLPPNKTNTIGPSGGHGGIGGPVSGPRSQQSGMHGTKYQTHHHHHHSLNGAFQQQQQQQPDHSHLYHHPQDVDDDDDDQLHHHHHHHHHPHHSHHLQQQQQEHHLPPPSHHHHLPMHHGVGDDGDDNEIDGGVSDREDDDTLDVNESCRGRGVPGDPDSGDSEPPSEGTSPPQSPLSPIPPELPVRNGLLPPSYNVALELNHINNNPVRGTGSSPSPPMSSVTPPPPSSAVGASSGSGRKTLALRHYH